MSRISPINLARWARFRANRHGYWSLWIFLVLFTLSLFAELLANDKPLLVRYDNRFYTPLLVNYPETTFGGQFATTTDFRDPYVAARIAQHGLEYLAAVPVSLRYH